MESGSPGILEFWNSGILDRRKDGILMERRTVAASSMALFYTLLINGSPRKGAGLARKGTPRIGRISRRFGMTLFQGGLLSPRIGRISRRFGMTLFREGFSSPRIGRISRRFGMTLFREGFLSPRIGRISRSLGKALYPLPLDFSHGTFVFSLSMRMVQPLCVRDWSGIL